MPTDEYELLELKKLGFSDSRLAELSGKAAKDILDLRREKNLHPVYKRVDTCAAEFEAITSYMYSTYWGAEFRLQASSCGNEEAFSAGSSVEKILETEHFYLKEFTDADVELLHELLHELHSDPDVNKYYNAEKLTEDTKSIIDSYKKSYDEHGFGKWAIFDKETDEFVGRAGIDVLQRKETEIAYMLHKRYWGKGYGMELGNAVTAWLFANTDSELAVGVTSKDNIGSRRILEKLGMKYIKEDRKSVV